MSSPTSTPTRSTRSVPRPAPSPAGAVTIDPIKVVRQHLLLLLITGMIGLVVGTGIFYVRLMYFPSYSGFARFELIGTLDDAGDAVAQEERNEETVQRLAGTEASKTISVRSLEAVLKEPEVQRIAWMDQFKDENGRPNLEEAVIELEDEISAGYVRRTQFFDVRWSAKVKTDVPVLLNAVADHYLKLEEKAARGNKLDAKQPFQESLESINQSITTLENTIDDFIADKGMLSLTLNTTSVQTDLEDRELERNEVVTDMQRTQGLLGQIDAKLAGTIEWSQDDVREAENDQVVIRALSEIQVLRGQLSEHKQKFGQDHTQYRQSQQALDARIRERDRKVEEVILRNLQGQRKQASDALERLQAIEKTLDDEITSKSAEMNDFVAAKAQLDKMEAELTRLEDRRTTLLNYLDEIEAMYSRKDAVEVQLLHPVLTPREPSAPKWYVDIPGTAILFLGLMTAGIFLKEILDKRVRTTADLTSMPGARLLGVIPDIKDDPTEATRPESVIRDSPGSVLAESHRQLAAAFRRVREDSKASSVLFVGGMPGAGTTSVVTNLAAIAAAAGRRIALIDGNLRRPRIAEVFGLDPSEPGLGDVIMGEAKLSNVVNTTQEGIKVVTAGTQKNRHFERLDSENLRKVIRDLSETVDVVFVDGPPVVVASEAMGMADQVDATVLVIRAYSEQRGLVARLMRQLRDQPSSFLGIVLNRPRNTAGGYFKRNYEAIAEYSKEQGED